jgi:hypothetical protein
MKAFEIPPGIDTLQETYPSAEVIIAASREGNKDSRYAMARLWLSEGIPYCFRSKPGLYESLRLWMSRRLNVQAKEVTLVGSGRQGYCLNSRKDFGRPFGERSDLDLTIVSSNLFEKLVAAFARWSMDYAAGTVGPKNSSYRFYWDENKKILPNNIARGFIDPYKIPSLTRYPEAQMIAQTMYEAHEKLKLTPAAPTVRKLSVRIYRNWDSFIWQMAINLEHFTINKSSSAVSG